MKQLIFIDNDRIEMAEEEARALKRRLYASGLDSVYLDTMRIIPDFRLMGKEEIYELLFSGKNIICTWSMYTQSHFDSLGQVLHFLASAARNEIKNVVYIDSSGNLPEALDTALRGDRKDAVRILTAVATNFILTYKDRKLMRMEVAIGAFHESKFKMTDITLTDLIQD